MKSKHYIAAALAGSLLLGGCAVSVPEEEPGIPAVPELAAPDIPDVHQSTLDEPEDAVYEEMCGGLRTFQNTVTIEGSVDGEALDEAFFRIGREQPALFWVTGYKASYTSARAEVEFVLLDGLQPAQLSQMTAELDSKADAIARQARMYPDDYARVLFVHDYIADHTEYDFGGASAGGSGIWGTAYGCLVNGSATCQGYAEAFLLVMQKLDIPAGIAFGMTEGGDHAWNYVYVNGAYYWVDVTWDDPSYSGEFSAIRHSYFLINDELLMRTRTIDTVYSGDLPECSAMQANYFVRNGDYLTEYRFTDIDARLSRSLAEGSIEVMFDEKSDLDAAVSELFEEGLIWNAAIFLGGTGTVHYSVDEEMCVLRVLFDEKG